MDRHQSCFQQGLLNTHLSYLCLQVSLLTVRTYCKKTVRTHLQSLPGCTRVFFFFLTITFHFSCPSHTIALNWNFIFRYKYTLRVPQLVWPVSRHQSASPCQTLRDRTTTGPGWRPWSEHAGAEKSGISLSGNLEQPRWRNRTKMPQGTKREKQLGEQEKATSSSATVWTFKQVIIYCHLYFKLHHCIYMILLTVMQQ